MSLSAFLRSTLSVNLRATLVAATLSGILPPVMLSASEPRSAIPWLSDVVRTGPDDLNPAIAEPGTVEPFDVGPIETSFLDDPRRDAVGLIPAAELGLPEPLWGNTSALRISRMLANRASAGVPAARKVFRDMLIAATAAPRAGGPANLVLLARIDALMTAGDLATAEALIDLAGVRDAELFRRAFDIGLLTDTVERRCEQLRASPGLSPTLPARVYCLARQGDWAAAALTLNLGREVGDITAANADLLARFLDPELFEGTAPPPLPTPLTTLDFTLREAVALPRPSTPLPLAFLHPDAGPDAPLRARLLARERLVRAGALPAADLFDAYREGAPAASGGVWDRVAAVQNLDNALATQNPESIGAAVATLDAQMAVQELRHAMATSYRAQLAALPPRDLPGQARAVVGRLLLLAGDTAAPEWFGDTQDPAEEFLILLATGSNAFVPDPALAPLKAAAATGLTAIAPPTEQARALVALWARGAEGEVLLRTLDLLAPGAEADPGDFSTALYVLRHAGLGDRARQIALETLLLLPPA